MTDFNEFLEKFSSDNKYQLNHIKFPFKEISYDDEDQRILENINKNEFIKSSMLDFRNEEGCDNGCWKQTIEISKNNSVANIIISGINNGIYIVYTFKLIENKWILIECDNRST